MNEEFAVELIRAFVNGHCGRDVFRVLMRELYFHGCASSVAMRNVTRSIPSIGRSKEQQFPIRQVSASLLHDMVVAKKKKR